MSSVTPGNGRALTATAIGLLTAILANAQSLLPALPANGWVSWQVEAVPYAPWLCCRGDGAAGACPLDGRGGWNVSGDGQRRTEAIRIFAWMDDGRATRVRALAAACPVQADSGIVELGEVDAAASVEWLERHIDGSATAGHEAVAALAMHAGAAARDALSSLAADGPSNDARRDAVFWMGQVRAHDSVGELERRMFDDRDPELRAHAAFSLAQSSIEDRYQSLEWLATTDASEHVRAQAWFWLAQTGAPEVETAIRRRLDYPASITLSGRRQLKWPVGELGSGYSVFRVWFSFFLLVRAFFR